MKTLYPMVTLLSLVFLLYQRKLSSYKKNLIDNTPQLRPKIAMATTTSLNIDDDVNDAFASSKNIDGSTTILAYGALLSEASSRLTFPDLRHFRHVKVRGLRRVFAHPHLFLLQNGLIDPTMTLAFASLSAEIVNNDSDSNDAASSSSSISSSSSGRTSFVAAAFDVILDDDQKLAFMKREISYDFVSVPYYNLQANSQQEPSGKGIICVASTDKRQGAAEMLAQLPKPLHVSSIWHWPRDSGLLPANIYLRHCLLAIEKDSTIDSSVAARESFYKDTYLVDRTTTLEEYLSDPVVLEQIMKSRPPPELATRFGG